jgi:hypothetical protein
MIFGPRMKYIKDCEGKLPLDYLNISEERKVSRLQTIIEELIQNLKKTPKKS